MTSIGPLCIGLLNIMANHTMLKRKKSIPFCVVAFIVNSFVILILSVVLKEKILNLEIYKYVFYLIAFLYLGYIYLVFEDSFPIKLFSMFSVWVFSTTIVSNSSVIYNLMGYSEVNIDVLNGIRLVLQLILLGVSYIWYGKYFKAVLSKIHDSIIYLMSGYMVIALILMVNSFSWNGQYFIDRNSEGRILLLTLFIILGYFIVFFGISSSSKNTLLKQNMSLLKEQSEINYKLANYDNLTGVASRQNIISQIEEAINQIECDNRKCILFMFDIDKFKSINDNFGHNVGDEALKYVVNKVKKCLREDDMIGRFGGDEFIVFPKSIHNKDDAEVLISRIIKVLKSPLVINSELIYIDISIGVSTFPTDARQIKDLLDQADKAMYLAKKRVGTTYEFYKN